MSDETTEELPPERNPVLLPPQVPWQPCPTQGIPFAMPDGSVVLLIDGITGRSVSFWGPEAWERFCLNGLRAVGKGVPGGLAVAGPEDLAALRREETGRPAGW